MEAALTYGPHLLREKQPLLETELEHYLVYLTSLGPYGASQVDVARQALDYLREAKST